MATELWPSSWPAAAAAIVIYSALFVYKILVTLSDIVDMMADAWSRYYMILITGLSFIFTVSCLDIIKPIAALKTAKEVAATGGLLARFIEGFTDMSLIFLAIKMMLGLWVFLVADGIFAATLLGVI